MPWTTPGYVASGVADSGKFNVETVDNLLYLFDLLTARLYRKTVAPAANRDVTSASMGDWTTETTTVTCPAWATRAIVETFTTGWYDAVGSGVGISLATSFGGVDGDSQSLSLTTGFVGRAAASWSDEFTGLTPGVLTVRPRARRSSGSGTLRADTSTKFSYIVTFLP